MEPSSVVALIILSVILALFFLWLFDLSYFIKNNLTRTRNNSTDPALDIIIRDLKRVTENVHKLKRASDNHTKLILKIFQILKDSIESDLSQDQVLEAINNLNLPLDKLKVESKND